MTVPPINPSIVPEGQQGWGEARARPGQRWMAAGTPCPFSRPEEGGALPVFLSSSCNQQAALCSGLRRTQASGAHTPAGHSSTGPAPSRYWGSVCGQCVHRGRPAEMASDMIIAGTLTSFSGRSLWPKVTQKLPRQACGWALNLGAGRGPGEHRRGSEGLFWGSRDPGGPRWLGQKLSVSSPL